MKLRSTNLIAVWSVVVLAIAALVLGAALAPIDGETGPGLFRFVGRFHPLALHLPIAFLVLAPLLEASRLSPRTAYLARFTAPVLFLSNNQIYRIGRQRWRP